MKKNGYIFLGGGLGGSGGELAWIFCLEAAIGVQINSAGLFSKLFPVVLLFLIWYAGGQSF